MFTVHLLLIITINGNFRVESMNLIFFIAGASFILDGISSYKYFKLRIIKYLRVCHKKRDDIWKYYIHPIKLIVWVKKYYFSYWYNECTPSQLPSSGVLTSHSNTLKRIEKTSSHISDFLFIPFIISTA